MEHLELEQVLRTIRHANSIELSSIVRGILARYGELFEEEEVFFLSAPKGDEAERERVMSAALGLERTRFE